mgnify:CR=1 FL=1
MAVDGGTARNGAWSPYVKLAAKTSTAQTAQGKDHTWITIFGPYNQRPTDDMVAVTVMLEHSGGGGGSTAGPIATAMLRSILSGENALEVRNSIYYRMQSIYEQLRIAREQACHTYFNRNPKNIYSIGGCRTDYYTFLIQKYMFTCSTDISKSVNRQLLLLLAQLLVSSRSTITEFCILALLFFIVLS